VWTSERVGKEAFLMWQICHKGIAVNEWRGKISIHIDKTCSICDSGSTESVAHRFWDCNQAQEAWSFAIQVVNRVGDIQRAGHALVPDFNQAVMA
jgi:hypothetical protein